MKRRIMAVIVLYKMTAEESISYRSLLRAVQSTAADELDLALLLHDNTLGAVAPLNLPPNVTYWNDGGNSGLASAYNHALTVALDLQYEWMLTLDQDTELPANCLEMLLGILTELDSRPDVAAVVPEIHGGGRIVSPNFFAGGALPRWFGPGYTGIPEQTVYAFNSGSLIRTAALRQIGGYSPWFWLDNSDSYLYRQLAKFGKRVYVAGGLKIDHDFSMLNMQERISPERYRTILLSESAFWDLEMNSLAGFERTARLIGRLGKHALRGDSSDLRRLTREALRARLFRSRKSRIQRWRTAVQDKLGSEPKGLALKDRPKVSVCMAAYNGERYIEGQLCSILPQLAPEDEIILINDASSDNTLEIVRRLQRELLKDASAPQILILSHSVNAGVIRTFEEAIRSATGDIIFLCDDDDLWAPDKVRKVLQVFAADPDTRIVATGLSLIDENDQPIPGSDFMRHRNFSSNFFANLLHNQFQGSAMAFRSSLLRDVLPLPPNHLFLHDVWIGTRNTLAGGKAIFLDEPLLLYRRHAGNYSRKMGFLKQLRLRMQLVSTHLARWFQRL